jgi:acid phosphatase (class A)
MIRTILRIGAGALGAALVIGCADLGGPPPLEPVEELRPGILAGYLPRDAYPDSLALVPPPPAAGSSAALLDEEVSRSARALRGSARWDLAATDAHLGFPEAAGTFSCALDAPISEAETPQLYRLVRRTLADAGLSTYGAKNHYSRQRPFLVNGEPTCTPDDEAMLAKDGSYPSGHTAIGWAWALILAEIAPERADAVLARGRAYGQSRVICNVHWQSDVIEGRFIGAAAVARLHALPEFRAAVTAAREEVADVRARGLPQTRDCEAEARALAELPPGAPWPADR